MKILRVFPARTSYTPTDEMAFVGDPPLWVTEASMRPPADEVHVSVTFTWDKEEGRRLQEAWAQYYPIVKIGGPAFGSPASEFDVGMYVKLGVTFTSRGCNSRCRWCLVPGREGLLRELHWFPDGYIINDNNFLQTSAQHRVEVYRMLREQPKPALFAGGLQPSLITAEIAIELRSIRIEEVFLAADTAVALRPLEKAVKHLQWIPPHDLRCYVLIGFDGETIEQAEKRLEAVWQIGCLPFAQLYQPPAERKIEYSSEWQDLNRKWSRPAITKAIHSKAGIRET